MSKVQAKAAVTGGTRTLLRIDASLGMTTARAIVGEEIAIDGGRQLA
jgi:hypothetical protein